MTSTNVLIAVLSVWGSHFVSGHHETTPEWKILLEDYKVWSGFYVHYNRPVYCSIVVQSVSISPNGVAFATFTDKEGEKMDFVVYDNPSDPTHVVTMEKKTSSNNTLTFPIHQKFMAVGNFIRSASIWQYKANITAPTNKGFTTLKLSPKIGDDIEDSRPPNSKDRSLSLGLAIGIPVALAIILVATGVGIGVWAVRKGYLRHVPLAYKNFRNPRDNQPVSFQKNDQTVEAGHTVENGQAGQGGQAGPNNVHM